MKIKSDKMYRVKGVVFDANGYGYPIDKRKVGSALTKKELALVEQRRKKTIGKSIAATVTAGLLAWGGASVIGHTGEEISEQDGARAVSAAAAQVYNGKSLREKFELTFVEGLRNVTVPSTRDGSGLLGTSYPYSADFGQTCLANTPYNTEVSEITGRSEGTIMPPAAFHMDEQSGDALVTPYGGDSSNSLRFSVNNGELLPTQATIATLAANNCVIVDGLPATTPKDDRGYTVPNVLDVSTLIRSIHPGDYKG